MKPTKTAYDYAKEIIDEHYCDGYQIDWRGIERDKRQLSKNQIRQICRDMVYGSLSAGHLSPQMRGRIASSLCSILYHI